MPITPEISQIATTLANAIAQATGLKPHQIEAIHADPQHIEIHYTGAQPGLFGAAGRTAIQTYDTQTGKLLTDQPYDDPEELARRRATLAAARASLNRQDPNLDRKTPAIWCSELGIQILDPDGWRNVRNPRDWDTPITRAEFEERAAISTQRSVAPVDSGQR